jgi:rare lipoprotein A
MKNFQARGAKYILALAAVGLLTSAPGMAVIPHDFAKGAESLAPAPQPVFAPIETIAPAEAEAEPALEHIGDGEASYYGRELAGNRTASGERFNPHGLTAAHRTLPLGTKLKVTNKKNGKSVVVRINDRGPFIKKRLIDLSLGAAQKVGMVAAGHAAVRLELLR